MTSLSSPKIQSSPKIISKNTNPTSSKVISSFSKSNSLSQQSNPTCNTPTMKPKKLEDTLDGINHRNTPNRPTNNWQKHNSFASLDPDTTSNQSNKISKLKPDNSKMPTSTASNETDKFDALQNTLLKAIQQLDAKLDKTTDSTHKNIKNLHEEFDTKLEQTNFDLSSKITTLEKQVNLSKEQLEDSVTMKDIAGIINTTKTKIESDIINKFPAPSVMNKLFEDVKDLKDNYVLPSATTQASSSIALESHHPILKVLRLNTIPKTFSDKIKDVNLQGDAIMNLQLFWDEIIAAMSIALGTGTNKLLPAYHQLYLHPNLSTESHLTLNPSHPSYADSLEAYYIFSGIVKTHLLRPTTIDQTVAPCAYNAWLLYKPITTNLDGIQIVHTIISNLSAQLNGPKRDVLPSIMKLAITNDMTLFEFQSKALTIFNELDLIRDDTGGKTKLVEQYLKQLSLIPKFDISIHNHKSDVIKTINGLGYIEPSHTIFKDTSFFEFIYNELTMNDPTNVIQVQVCPQRTKTIPIMTTGEKS